MKEAGVSRLFSVVLYCVATDDGRKQEISDSGLTRIKNFREPYNNLLCNLVTQPTDFYQMCV